MFFFVSLQILAKMHQNTNLEHSRKTMKRRLANKIKNFKLSSADVEHVEKATASPPETTPTNTSTITATTPPPTAPTTDSIASDSSSTKSAGHSSSSDQNKTNELLTIETACRIHEDLCDACFITEEYFSVVMLTIVTIGFLIIVFNAYYVLEVLFRHGGNIDTETTSFIVFLVYQMFIHGLGLLSIVQNSSAVFEEVCKCIYIADEVAVFGTHKPRVYNAISSSRVFVCISAERKVFHSRAQTDEPRDNEGGTPETARVFASIAQS